MVIASATPHPDEAFRGGREVIEAAKHQAPIWKQEHFIDGMTEWSEGCSLCGHEPAQDAAGAPAAAAHGAPHAGHDHAGHDHAGHAHAGPAAVDRA